MRGKRRKIRYDIGGRGRRREGGENDEKGEGKSIK